MAPGGVAPESLTYAAARERVLAAARPLAPERVALRHASGRALREGLTAPHPLPPFTNTAMDGFALRASDLAGASEAAPVTLEVAAILPAGRVSDQVLAPGACVRIMTGAAIPDGADAVVPVEDAEWLGDGESRGRARFRRPARERENVRLAGADVAAGALALEAGRELSPHDLALAGSLGCAMVDVGPRPRVAVFSTGDELLHLDAALRPGAIRDGNLPMLAALVEAAGGVVVMSERLPDDPERVAAAVGGAVGLTDVVLTIGGVSAGDFDPVKQALASLGGVSLWRVAMRPGRPQAFGAPGGKLFYGLPGNPASVACVFEVLVRPALRRLQGFGALDRPRVPVRAATAIASVRGRTDFVRALLEWRAGELWASPAGEQVSGHMSPQSRAHALLVVPEDTERLEPGERAEALVLRLP